MCVCERVEKEVLPEDFPTAARCGARVAHGNKASGSQITTVLVNSSLSLSLSLFDAGRYIVALFRERKREARGSLF